MLAMFMRGADEQNVMDSSVRDSLSQIVVHVRDVRRRGVKRAVVVSEGETIGNLQRRTLAAGFELENLFGLKGGMPVGCVNLFGTASSARDREKIASLQGEISALQSNLQAVKSENQLLKASVAKKGATETAETPTPFHQTELRSDDKPFTEERDDEEVARALFHAIDTDGSGSVSFNELHVALGRFCENKQNELVEALENLMKLHFLNQPVRENTKRRSLPSRDAPVSVEGFPTSEPSDSVLRSKTISFDTFFAMVRELPRVRGERVQWAGTLSLDKELARLLVKGDLFDGLKGLKEIPGDFLDEYVQSVCNKFSVRFRDIFWSALVKLRKGDSMNAMAFQNSKFALDGSFKGSFASLQQFHDGPEKMIGTPNPKVWEGMHREHSERSNAQSQFTTANYGITTCPAVEWELVDSPRKGIVYPHTPKDKQLWNMPAGGWQAPLVAWQGQHGRDVISLDDFLELVVTKAKVDKIGLHRAEVIAVRLYTGPMYAVYNAVLRKHPPHLHKSLEGNQYESTIFCIISAILKLSKDTKIPPNRRLYRGVGGMILPAQFWREKEGFRGGVEWGLMSTTTDKHVAIQYSGVSQQRGTIFEIEAGRIDIGAELGWVSQYPTEEEFLFPPLSCLEVIGEPRVEDGVIVFPLRVNVCLKGITLEQLVERRKNLHMAMAKNLGEELSFQAAADIAEYQVALSPHCLGPVTCAVLSSTPLPNSYCATPEFQELTSDSIDMQGCI